MNMGQVYCTIDFSRARDELNYTPAFSLDEGVKDYIETMRQLNIQPMYRPLDLDSLP
jgi:nucleoside-diphosphate-sugar epimerase